MGAANSQIQQSNPHDEQSLTKILRKNYTFLSKTQLLHNQSKKLHNLFKMTGYSKQQSIQIQRTIRTHKRSNCQSIMRMKQHYKISKDSYCSNQQTYYLLLEGDNNKNIKQEYQFRRKNNKMFTNSEILNIVSCVLCGLRQYQLNFKRKELQLHLQQILIDRDNYQLTLQDPDLPKNSNQQNQFNTNLLASYPSPEKMQASISALEIYDEYYSNLFSAGIIGVTLSDLSSEINNLYVSKYGINSNNLNNKIRKISDSKLKTGLQILLSDNPLSRKDIYQYWNINCSQKYQIQSAFHSHFAVGSQISSSSVLDHPSQQTIRFQNKNNINQESLMKISKCSTNKFHGSTISIREPTKLEQPNFNHNKIHIPLSINNNNNLAPQNPWNKNKQSFNHQSHRNEIISPNFSQISYGSNRNRAMQLNMLGIPKTQSRIKPIPINQISTQTQKRYSSLDSHYNNSYSPNPISSNQRNRNQNMKTSLQFQPYSIKIQNDGYYQNTIPYSKIKEIKTDRTMETHVPEQANSKMKFSHSSINTEQNHPSPHIPKSLYNLSTPQNNAKNYGLSVSSKEKDSGSYRAQQIVDNQAKYHLKGSPNISSPDLLSKDPKLSDHTSPIQLNKRELGIREELKPVLQNGPGVFFTERQTDEQQQDHRILKTPRKKFNLTRKNNSTIVQVNQETPRSSEGESETEGQMEYISQEYTNGSKFEGFKKNNKKTGRGKYYYVDGGFYDGNWKNDFMHGWGKLYYKNAKVAYEGNWDHNEFHGYGRVFNDNPVPLQDGFDYTNFDGLGDYWIQYSGMFFRDTKQGRGKIIITNGQIFEGDFHCDKVQGSGKFFRNDETVIQGMWRDCKLKKIFNN